MNRPRQFVQEIYRKSSQKLGARLLNEMLGRTNLRPTFTLSRLGAFLLATIVYVLTLGMLLLGAWLLWQTFFNVVLTPLSLVLVLLGIAARPRVPRMPKTVVTRKEYPALFAYADRIADLLHTRPVYGIVFDWDYNASFGQYGWRRSPVMTLGLPLFEVLNAQERNALVAHELAHGANGDPNRGFYIGTAYYSVLTWYQIFYVRQIESGFSRTLANLGMRLLSFVPYLFAKGMAYLMWRDMQRAEYLADYLAAKVAGKEACLGLLQKTEQDKHFAQLVHTLALNTPQTDLFQELRRAIQEPAPLAPMEEQPHSEYELDASHPPTDYRIRFLKARGAATPKLVVSPEEWARIETELLPAKKEVQEKLLDRYMRTKYL